MTDASAQRSATTPSGSPGALGAELGVVATMWIGALLGLSSALFAVLGPFWTMRELPDAAASARP